MGIFWIGDHYLSLIVLLAAILFYGMTNFDVIAVRVRTFYGVLTPLLQVLLSPICSIRPCAFEPALPKAESPGVGWRF